MLSIFRSRCNKHNPLRRVSFYVNFVTNASLQKWFNWLSTTDKDKKMENMTELERKFIIMARIVVALNRKGVWAGVNFIDGGEECILTVRLANCDDENYQIETHFDFERTEAELLEWWSAIDGEQCEA